METPPTEPKAGPLTTEFWVTVFSAIAPVVTFLFQKDLSSQVQPLAASVAALVSTAYVISRAWTKSAYIKASTSRAAAVAVPLGLPADAEPDQTAQIEATARQLLKLVDSKESSKGAPEAGGSAPAVVIVKVQ